MNKKTVDEIEKLEKNLLNLHSKLRKNTKQQWNRVLPFEELLFDRWEKAKFLKSKKNVSIYHNNYIFGDVSIGENTWVGPFTVLDGSGGKLKIGKFCSISSGVQIYTHHTLKWSLTGGKSKIEKADVQIGNNCYLGPYSIISKGVKIGNHCIIGSHTLVNKNIPSNSIVSGNPAKVVGKTKINGTKVDYIFNE